MKYYCHFYHNGYEFPAYVLADSLKEAIQKANETDFVFLSVSGCEIWERFVNFTSNWIPENVTLKDLRFLSLSWKQKKQIKELIKAGTIQGKVSLFRTEINLLSFIQYCIQEAQKSFSSMDYNSIFEKTKPQTTSDMPTRDFVESLTEIFEEDEPGAKEAKDKKIVEVKKRHLEENKRIPSVFEVKKENVNESMELALKFDMDHFLMWGKHEVLIYMFKENFDSPMMNMSYLFILQAMLEGYTGFKIDGRAPNDKISLIDKKRKPQFYYLTKEGEFELNKKLEEPPVYLHPDFRTTILAYMNVPYEEWEGTWENKLKIGQHNVTFTSELKIEEYGQSIVIKWPVEVVYNIRRILEVEAK